ncbi:inositol polyphosphate multikinase [Patella vulgata]|uniref:inositol polyphosphate multikinase n=1 Tax=Patella vulgata TaxID=6465 RepID=UPI00217FEE19|nr:inositol polyphosphate multikinase [Patella vulgata]
MEDGLENDFKKAGIVAEPLSTQVAGCHTGNAGPSNKTEMLDIGNGYVLKLTQAPPRGPREIGFYEKVFDEKTKEKDLLALRPHLPQFYGSHVYNSFTYLKLENITSSFRKPSVMDVKIGAISWDPEATEAKINQEKSKFPPAQKVGFRFAGMRVYNQESDSFEVLNNYYCYSLTEETILSHGFERFFRQGKDIQKNAIQVILSKLKDIEQWFVSQRTFSFFSTSLLLVYESSVNSIETPQLMSYESENKINKRPQDHPVIADVRMIDFAHVFSSNSQDENYLHGLRSVIFYLNSLLHSV